MFVALGLVFSCSSVLPSALGVAAQQSAQASAQTNVQDAATQQDDQTNAQTHTPDVALQQGAQASQQDAQTDAQVCNTSEKQLQSIEVTYSENPTDATPTYKTYDPTAQRTAENTPAINTSASTIQFSALLTFFDSTTGQTETVAASMADAGIVWAIANTYDTSGAQTQTQLAKIEQVDSQTDDAHIPVSQNQDGLLTPLKAGNGSLKITCTSTVYASVAPIEISVNINGNEPDPTPEPDPQEELTATSAALYYRCAGETSLKEYAISFAGANTPSINLPGGSCTFDALISYTNKAGEVKQQKFASELGVSLAINVISGADIATWASGVCTALNAGNGTVLFSATALGLPVTWSMYGVAQTQASINITGNDAKAITPLYVGLNYSDWRCFDGWEYPYNEDDLPQIVMLRGNKTNVSLGAYVVWSNYSVTKQGQDSLEYTWEIVNETDLEGNTTSNVATIDASGNVSASSSNSGYAYFKCTVAYADSDEALFTTEAKVEIILSESYVHSIQIVNSDGEPYGTGVVLPDGENLLDLGVKVTYRVLDEETGVQRDVEKNSFYEPIEGLTWANYYADTETPEQYSVISDSGTFTAESGFTQARVQAKIVGGGYFGNDITADLRVSRESTEEDLGYTSEISVQIVEESDYKKYRNGGELVSKDITVTRDQMQAYCMPYNCWYTFQKRGYSWGTAYVNGISIGSFLNLCGVDSSQLVTLYLTGADGYQSNEKHSAQDLLGTQYRYSNYYMRKLSTDPGYLGQSNVAPMLALSWYYDNGNNPNDSGYANLGSNGTIRFVWGMKYGPADSTDGENNGANNASGCIYKLSNILIVIADQPKNDGDDPPSPEDPEIPDTPIHDPTGGGGGGNASGSASGTGGSGGGTGSGTGSGSSSSNGEFGGAASGGSPISSMSVVNDQESSAGSGNSTGGGDTQQTSQTSQETPNITTEKNTRMRELEQNGKEAIDTPEAQVPFLPETAAGATAMFLGGAIYAYCWYRRQLMKRQS